MPGLRSTRVPRHRQTAVARHGDPGGPETLLLPQRKAVRVMDNWDGATPWLKKQARWSIPDMTRAVHLQCKFCNDAEVFTDGNDCVSHVCPLFPFRPGSCRQDVASVKRAVRNSRPGPGNVANLRNTPSGRRQILAIGTEGKEPAKVTP